MNYTHNNHEVSLAPTYLKKTKIPSLIENMNEVPASQVCNFIIPSSGEYKKAPSQQYWLTVTMCLMLQSKLYI